MHISTSVKIIWEYMRQHRFASIIVGHIVVMTIAGALLFSNSFGSTLFGVFAQSACGAGEQTYTVQSGDTLGAIAQRYNTTWQNLSSHNSMVNPNVIYIGQSLCIPGSNTQAGSAPVSAPSVGIPQVGLSNLFPAGQCTWWANQRYFQLHGVYVPWTINSDAWEWVARANDFHWTVSSQPSAGAIVVLQPNVQWAGSVGHVAIVESIAANGDAMTSNLDWAPDYGNVSYHAVTPGPGVSFITI